jgi:hypothetical protein
VTTRSTFRRRLEVVIGTPFTEGNAADRSCATATEIFPAMLEAIRGAHIHRST